MRTKESTLLFGCQRGQAATEFIITAVFLLIPLFLTIPLLGKYIDIKHAAISQARFEAWEYSVWDGPKEDVMTDIKSTQSAGRLPYAETRKKGLNYFFSNPTSKTYGTSQNSFQANPLWVDHRGDSLFASTEIINGNIKEDKTPDGLKGVLDTILEVISFVFKAFGDIMNLVHVDAKFDAMDLKGYYTSNVNIKVRSLDTILPYYSLDKTKKNSDISPLIIHAKAAVLTDGWNAGSTDNAISESRGLVVTALLKPVTDTVNGIISGINSMTSHIPLLRVTLPSVPDFGYVKNGLIPYEHLEDNKKELKDKSGLYYYE